MTPLQMAHEAARVLAETRGATLGVVFDVPKGGLPRGFPRGELLNERREEGRYVRRTYSFDPDKVLSWLVRNGLIELDRTGGRTMVLREPAGHPPPATSSVIDSTVSGSGRS